MRETGRLLTRMGGGWSVFFTTLTRWWAYPQRTGTQLLNMFLTISSQVLSNEQLQWPLALPGEGGAGHVA